ncbi:MAG: hypothetical protein QXW52_08690 [Candidatus Caldarchaeum sp.]
MSELEAIVERLKSGDVIYAAVAKYSYYSGSLVSGSTKHIPITVDSQPVFNLTVTENEKLGLIKRVSPMWSRSRVKSRWDVPLIEYGETIYINDAPFKVWVQHRGWTGDRDDSYDVIISSVEIKTVQELLDLFK